MNPLYRYAVYGLTVASEQPMQSLTPAAPSTDAPDVTVSFVDSARFRSIVSGEVPKADPDNWVAYALRADGSVHLKAEDIFEVVVSADGRTVTSAAPGTIDRRTFEANLMNFVLATSLTLQGEEPLHATVVDLGGRAIGLLGQSGAGKSTLAAFLISRGADLVTDDMLRLEFEGETVLAHPGPYRLKLLEEAGRRFLPDALADGHFNAVSGKTMVRPRATGGPASGPIPLAGLFYIGGLEGHPPPHCVEAIPLVGLDTARVLFSSAMDDRYTPPGRLARQMAFAERLAGALPIVALRYPRRFEVMDEVAAQIRQTAGL